MSSQITLPAEPRTEFGKGAARRLRRAGQVPAVVYGHGEYPVHLSLPGHQTMLALKHRNTVLSLDMGGAEHLALAKFVQRDPIRGTIEHVDFVTVRRGEMVQVDISVLTTGDPQTGTVVTVGLQSITVSADAMNLPESVHVDVTDAEQVEALFADAHAERGRIDIAMNNAGINPPDDASIVDTGLDVWRRVQEVNLTSVYLCCKAVLPYMRQQQRGSIINTASFVAVMGAATSQISYSASKGGVLSMTRELGVEFAREGIRINALCPGPVNTPLLAELFASDPKRAARRLVHVPMGRFAEPEEIAAAAAFLASDDSSFMTASSFLVDGGISGAYVTPV